MMTQLIDTKFALLESKMASNSSALVGAAVDQKFEVMDSKMKEMLSDVEKCKADVKRTLGGLLKETEKVEKTIVQKQSKFESAFRTDISNSMVLCCCVFFVLTTLFSFCCVAWIQGLYQSGDQSSVGG